MCICGIFLSNQQHDLSQNDAYEQNCLENHIGNRFPFIILNNRDEFITRPTSDIGFWTNFGNNSPKNIQISGSLHNFQNKNILLSQIPPKMNTQ